MGLRTRFALLFVSTLAACAPQPEPRTFFDFMEDGLAREGVLTRCNRNRDATLTDEECANARRAAAAIALEAERAHAPLLERESEIKLAALRDREARAAAAAQATAAAELAAAEAAYEARWPGPAGARGAGASGTVPAFGTPVGSVLPSMANSASFDVYAEGATTLGRHNIEVAAAEPPANEVLFASPELGLADLAKLPRPFHTEENVARQ